MPPGTPARHENSLLRPHDSYGSDHRETQSYAEGF